MREYGMKAQESQVMKKVVCNCCGKEIPQIREGIWADYFHAEKAWGYLSAQDGRQDSFDLCEDCYKKMVNAFKIPLQ